MRKTITAISFFLSAAAICAFAMSAGQSPPATERADVFTIFLTGNELGAMKPCGCSGGQLGGLDRRKAVFDTVNPQNRLIADTGSLVKSDSEQDRIKFNIIVQSFAAIGYDVVNLTESDIQIATDLGIGGAMEQMFNPITANKKDYLTIPPKFTKKILLGKTAAEITIAAALANLTTPQQIEELFGRDINSQKINILILDRHEDDLITSLSELDIVDCFVCPTEYDEPELLSEKDQKPLIVSVGLFGKYVSKLQIKKIKAANKLTLDFSHIPVTENLPQQSDVVELYKDYQQVLKNANLLEKYPRFVLPKDLTYIGSASCKLCHEYEYNKWSEKPHAHAYATLEKVGSQYDPECVLCHVVGLEYNSGFVSEQRTPNLKDVGCENCHGPGSEHLKTLGKTKTAEPKSDCTACHTPENSANYSGNEKHYLEQIIHWREPNRPADVKDSKD